MNKLPIEIDYDEDYTTQELEVIQLELQEFLNTKAYQLLLRVCDCNKVNLSDTAICTPLKGVETLFTRESIFGESIGWGNMKSLFPELLEELANNLNNRKK